MHSKFDLWLTTQTQAPTLHPTDKSYAAECVDELNCTACKKPVGYDSDHGSYTDSWYDDAETVLLCEDCTEQD